ERDREWGEVENHPWTAELAADIEPPPARPYNDETHLDFNALIDVCLVLLIFFILTTTVAALQKRLEAPSAEKGGVVEVTQEQAAESMVHVAASMQGDRPIIKVGDTEVELDQLMNEIDKRLGSRKRAVLLEHDDDVPHGVIIKIIDSAKGAGVDSVKLLVP